MGFNYAILILMNKDQIKYLLRSQQSEPLPQFSPREQPIPFAAGKIISLIGVRRVGKTFLLFQRIKKLLDSGVSRQQIVYLNFEDDRIWPIREGEFALIPQAHAELFPDLQEKPVYYFFDEIQNAPGWERVCRRLYDTDKKCTMVVTGSSSHFLAREVASELRGRSLPIEVFPLSFREFLQFRNVSVETFSTRSEQKLYSELENYLKIGGLPEVVLAEEAVRTLILREYNDLVLYKDLIDRHHLSNPLVMKELLRHCLSNPASLINVAKIYNDFKSRGLKVGKDTLHKYLDILQDSYLIFLLPLAERSLRKRAINPKKMHLIDWSIGYTFIADQQADMGHKLENAVFLSERRANPELGYLSSPAEIDLVDSRDRPRRFINVCWSLANQSTYEREVQALTSLKSGEKILVAQDLPTGATVPHGIKIIPAWRYLYEAETAGTNGISVR